MANVLKDKFPKNDSAMNINKLMEFCPRVKTLSLLKALKDATELDGPEVSQVLNFLSTKSSPENDLWCQPLIKTNKNEYAILVSALISPSIFRLVENWARELEIDLDKKGYTSEKTVVAELNNALKENHLIKNYDEVINKRIKINAGEEEFDLLTRIDDLVIIGECKSIVTTDSEISKYRTSEILQHASAQVIRKTKFLNDNLENIFDNLKWKYEHNKKYNIVQCIVNSGKVFVGHKFNDIPVVDEDILRSYFDSSMINLLSIPKKDGIKTIAYYELYNDLNEFKDNFSIYLSSPPQLSESRDSYEYYDWNFPFFNENSFKISKRYFVLKESEEHRRMNREHKFRVIKSADYDDEIANINFLS